MKCLLTDRRQFAPIALRVLLIVRCPGDQQLPIALRDFATCAGEPMTTPSGLVLRGGTNVPAATMLKLPITSALGAMK